MVVVVAVDEENGRRCAIARGALVEKAGLIVLREEGRGPARDRGIGFKPDSGFSFEGKAALGAVEAVGVADDDRIADRENEVEAATEALRLVAEQFEQGGAVAVQVAADGDEEGGGGAAVRHASILRGRPLDA